MSVSTKRNISHEWKGTIPDLPVAIDCFKLKRGIECFFLSHAHSDHYIGLTSGFFTEDMTHESKIYCTEITRTLLLAKFPTLPSERIISLEMSHSHQIILSKNRYLLVTVINANHCPGSAMFLFQSTSMRETILYTGDFRFELEYYNTRQIIHNQMNIYDIMKFLRSKAIGRIYLDATFCDPFFYTLPSRRESIKQIIALIQKERKDDCPVYMSLEMLGTEPILISLANTFKTKIFIDKENLSKNRYREIMSMDFLAPYITSDRSETRFRIVSFETLKGMYELLKDESDQPLFIRTTTMWIKQLYEHSIGVSGIPQDVNQPKKMLGIWYILFSIHSSLSEMKMFIKEIVGSQPIPNILPLSADIASIQKTKDIIHHFEKLDKFSIDKDNYQQLSNDPIPLFFDYSFMTDDHNDLVQMQDSATYHHSELPPSLEIDIEDFSSCSSTKKENKIVSEQDYDPENLLELLGASQPPQHSPKKRLMNVSNYEDCSPSKKAKR